jgi:hypothetical protein
MQKHVICLRGAAIATIAAGLISLPMMSVGRAHQRPEAMPIDQHWAGYAYEHHWSERELSRPARNPAAYHGHFALPEFQPEYHGSNGG